MCLETPLRVPLGEIRVLNRTHMANMKESKREKEGKTGGCWPLQEEGMLSRIEIKFPQRCCEKITLHIA